MIDYGGSLEQLTTPKAHVDDAVFPAENWFLYWKTSPSLWEQKLAAYQGPSPIFVPINWALHNEYPEQFDFGQTKPESDLKRLLDCALKQNKEIVFLLPISPAPFMRNSGLPAYLARNLALNKEGIALAVLDREDEINKVYSYFDPNIFQAFRKFVWNLGQYFTQAGISIPLFSLDVERIESGHFVSYFKDHSSSFEVGFNRYIKQLQNSEPQKVERMIENPQYELDLKHEYSQLIKSLYSNCVEEFLAGNHSGTIRTALIGGSGADIFKRSNDLWEFEQDYFYVLMKCLTNKVYPCSILLGPQVKKNSLKKALKDIVDHSLIQSSMSEEYYSDESHLGYRPLVFFHLVDEGRGFFSFEKSMDNSGLSYFFKTQYPWSYHIQSHFPKEIEELDEMGVYFFFGKRLTEEQFRNILRIFMNGHRVFIDVSEMPESFVKKLEVFYAENEIKVERINYISPVSKATLGEGSLITYESEKLYTTSLIKRNNFWDTMVNYLDLKHLRINADENVEYFWKTRSSNSFELSYQEVRRVSFYNPTSYRKKAHVTSAKNFAFIKSIDQNNVEVKSTPIGIDIEMKPHASVTLDFGYFES